MKFKSDIEVQAGLRDGSDDIGTAGQILSSTGSKTNWINQDAIISAASKLVVIACKNTSGATIAKGTPVYQTGTVGATDVIEIAEADASDEDKMAAIGLLQTDINNNDFGNVVITGELLNLTTDPIDGITPTTGDTIYVKSGGGLTLTKPTGLEFIQNVGLVGKVSGGNSGSLTVSSIMRSNDVPTPLYIDHDNQRLGVGETSPDVKLHVAGDSTLATQGTVLKVENTADQGSSQDIHIYNQYDRDIGIKFETLGGTNYIWQDSNSDDALILSSGGNNRTNDSTLILKQDHNVLIPNGSLLINATTKAFNDKFYINSDAYATGGWRVGTAATYVGKLINDGGKLTLMSDGSRDVQIGNNNNPSILYVDTSEEKVGIGITTPTSKLHINQSVTNPDLDLPASFAVEIDSNHSGSAATTGDREQGGLYIDVDSSTTGGDTADEHRLYGINNNVNHTGDADLAYAISNRVEQNTTAGTTTNVIGSYSAAISDGGSGAVLTNITGVYGSVDMQDATPVSNSYGGQFLNNTNANRTGATINSYGIRSEIQIGSTSAYTSLYAGHFSIDSNAAYTASNSYLLYLDYAGASLATNTYAIYSGDDVKSYHAGSFGIGTTTPDYKLDVEGSANNADIGIRINNTFDDNDPASEPNAVLFLNAASNNGYLRVHGAPANTAAKHQIDLGSTAGSSFLTFSPGDAERMRITTDGNVGINTTSPDFKLDVDGTFGVSDLPFNTDSVSVLVADETIASEIITNGDFDTDLTDWTNSSSYPWTSATWTSSGVSLQTSGSAQYKSFYQDIGPITSGKTYKISYSAVKTSGTMRVGVETSPVGSSVGYGKSLTSSEVVSEIFTATATDATCVISFWGQNDSSTNEWVIDNVSIKEVTFASNQIQKRELGTGAFGPTPVGAYLPLTAGSGEILTGDLAMNNNIGIITKDTSGAFRDILKLNSSNVLEIGSSALATDTIFKNTGDVGIGTTIGSW